MNTITLEYYNFGRAEGRIDFDGGEYQYQFEVESLDENTGDFVSLADVMDDKWVEVGGIKLSRIVPQIVKELQPKLFELIDKSIQDDADNAAVDRLMNRARVDSSRQILANGKAVVE